MKQQFLDDIKNQGTYLLVFLDTLTLKRNLNYHDLMSLWQEFFSKIEVKVYIVIPDNIDNLEKWKSMYRTNYEYIYCDDDTLKDFHIIRKKSVFGKSYDVINVSMLLYHGDQLIEKVSRINNKSIKKVFFRALELQYESFIKKIEKIVDTEEKL